jgi:beta-glucanase (GH16 family)
MRFWHIFVTVYFSSMAASAAIAGQAASTAEVTKNNPSSAEYKLVWSDEFDKEGRPDPAKWTYETGLVRNEELQWYQPENARCEKGLLIIEARRQRKQNPRYNPDSKNWKQNRQYSDYTSASITTRGLHHWMYGRFEMRGRIDTRPGLWPAFWTLGSKGRWPSCGEIDIMEYYRGLLLANAAWASQKPWVPEWDDIKIPITNFNDPDWSAKFHVWRMDWEADSIKLYVDDRLLNTIDLNKAFNKDSSERLVSAEGRAVVARPLPEHGEQASAPASRIVNPFRQPHYIILNLAVGGSSGGDPSNTNFPAKFEVDYVRIYQK